MAAMRFTKMVCFLILTHVTYATEYAARAAGRWGMSEKHPYTAIKHGKVYLVVGVQYFALAYKPCEDNGKCDKLALRWMRDMLDKAIATIITDNADYAGEVYHE
jgi:hypothetical protein